MTESALFNERTPPWSDICAMPCYREVAVLPSVCVGLLSAAVAPTRNSCISRAVSTELAASRAAVNEFEQTYGQQARGNSEAQRPTMRGFKIAQAGLSHQIKALEVKCRTLQARLAALPKRLPVKAVLDEAEIVKLAPEAKHLIDTIKRVAYRAETAFVQ